MARPLPDNAKCPHNKCNSTQLKVIGTSNVECHNGHSSINTGMRLIAR